MLRGFDLHFQHLAPTSCSLGIFAVTALRVTRRESVMTQWRVSQVMSRFVMRKVSQNTQTSLPFRACVSRVEMRHVKSASQSSHVTFGHEKRVMMTVFTQTSSHRLLCRYVPGVSHMGNMNVQTIL